MVRMLVVLVGSLWVGVASAQMPPAAPAPGSAGGGPVGASVTSPVQPTGKTPPGTPSATTPDGRAARDDAGQSVIGHTATTGTIPGNTGGDSTGAK